MDGHSYVVIWTLEISKKRDILWMDCQISMAKNRIVCQIFCGWIVRMQWPKKGLFVRMRGAKEEYREVRGEGRGFKTT